MDKKNEDNKNNNCCQLEAIVSFDERGQLVLPKDVRNKFKLEPGEKFALISCMSEDSFCCFTLMKTSAMEGMVNKVLSPVFSNLK